MNQPKPINEIVEHLVDQAFEDMERMKESLKVRLVEQITTEHFPDSLGAALIKATRDFVTDSLHDLDA